MIKKALAKWGSFAQRLNVASSQFVKICLVGFIFSTFAAGACAASGNTLQYANYKIFVGDVNGDGREDILMKAEPRFISLPIDDDIFVPVLVPPSAPSFVLISDPYWGYALVSNPDAQFLQLGWRSSNYPVQFGTSAEQGNTVRISSAAGEFVVTLADATKQFALVQSPGGAVGSGNITYVHTDGLGSPVAKSDASGNIISRTLYEPYGYVAAGAVPTVGFTGHVNDSSTGLTYMQQRYYDPVAGRFLSIDPVVTDANTGSSFNRYVYSDNNPYKYVDPDGRTPVAAGPAFVGGTFVCGPVCGGIAVGVVVVGGSYGAAKFANWLESRSEPKKDGQGASDQEKANSVGGPTGGKRVPSGLRDEILSGSQNPDGTWTCWRCDGIIDDPSKVDIGHRNTPRTEGGNLHPDNLRCEGQACNRSSGNRGQPKKGSDCISKGCAKPPEPSKEPPKNPQSQLGGQQNEGIRLSQDSATDRSIESAARSYSRRAA